MRKLQAVMMAAVLASVGVVQAASNKDNQKVWDDAMAVARTGPVDVPLLDQAVLHLPAGEVFVPQPQADKLLNSFGNPGTNPEMPGIVLPRDPKATWIMPVRFHKAGYIKDDEARTWDAQAMLRSLSQGTEEQNQERAKAGVPSLEVVGWSEPPRYESAQQRLVWALTSHVVGDKPEAPNNVNYNTYALGREGYFSMNMVTTEPELPRLKAVAQQQIAALEYNAGKRYADFDPKTDRVAGYGLVGMVVGAVDHRQSFIAQAVAFGRQYAAAILAALVVLAGVVLALRRRKPAPAAVAAASSTSPVAPVLENTVAEPAVAGSAPPVPPVDLDLGDGSTTPGAPHGAA
jgi:uncharacterized membrane-anchored protein